MVVLCRGVVDRFRRDGRFRFWVGMLLPFVGKTDVERRIMLNSVGPIWEGNQTWFITAGGALFAAWPLAYAAAFSGFYIAFDAITVLCSSALSALIIAELADPRWRSTWDLLFIYRRRCTSAHFWRRFGNLF